MSAEFDRRDLLRAGGLISLAAVVSACSGKGEVSAATPSRPTTSSPAPAPTAVGAPPPPPAPSAVDLLAGAPTCVLTTKTIAGPTWFDAHDVRSDIRDNRPGVPLRLAFRVVQLPSCAPLPQAVVDLWQCDALGFYSGFAGAAAGDGGAAGGRDQYGDAQAASTDAERFLRGTQMTDATGLVQFSTVYPGWYPTRTVHLHLKVHLAETTVLTTQLFFDDAVSDAVHSSSDPYRRHPGRDTRNPGDAFYSPTALLTTAPAPDGWLAAITLGVR
jgi:protocatechuate 3,4-dioxygenase beta subunit